MARTDTLGHFLTDVADAIREKKGSSNTIQASDFDTEIENLPSGGNLQEKTITINENGTVVITPDDGYDGISSISIITDVPQDSHQYVDLEYLTSPSGAYLETYIQATNDIEVEIKFACGNYNNKPLFGTLDGADYYHVTLYNYAYYWGLNNGEGHGGSFTPNINTPHTLIFNNASSQVIVDGDIIGSCSGTTSSKTLQLFRRQNYYLGGRVYYVIVRNKNTNTVLLNLLPKRQYGESTVITGFYDTVNNVFFGSSSSTSFTG